MPRQRIWESEEMYDLRRVIRWGRKSIRHYRWILQNPTPIEMDQLDQFKILFQLVQLYDSKFPFCGFGVTLRYLANISRNRYRRESIEIDLFTKSVEHTIEKTLREHVELTMSYYELFYWNVIRNKSVPWTGYPIDMCKIIYGYLISD